MATAFIAHCHDRKRQGKHVPGEPTNSEWYLAHEVNKGIATAFTDTGHLGFRLGSTLHSRIASIRDHCRKLPDSPTVAVEVHFNEMPGDDHQHGFFCMAYHRSKRAIQLSEFILEEIEKVRPGAKNRGVNKCSTTLRWIGKSYEYKDGRLSFLLDIPCPSVIVEAGYLSNPLEASWMKVLKNRQALGGAVGRGIINFLEV